MSEGKGTISLPQDDPKWSQDGPKNWEKYKKSKNQFIIFTFDIKFIEMIALGGGLEGSLGGLGGSLEGLEGSLGGLGGSWGAFWRVCGAT